MQKLFCLFFVFSLSIFFSPSFADCGDETPNKLDKECASTCAGTDDDPKGCYHLAEDGSATTDDICKEVSDGKYTKARGTLCCCKD